MNYSYEINVQKKTIFVKLTGNITTKELAFLDKEIRTKAKMLNYKVLFDFRDSIQSLPVSETDLWLDSNYYKSFNDLMTIPVAFILNDNFSNFLNITSIPQNFPFKVFNDDISASQWLAQF